MKLSLFHTLYDLENRKKKVAATVPNRAIYQSIINVTTIKHSP